MLYVGSEPIRVTGLPYVVGRRSEIGEPAMASRPDLEIPDPKPYRLSRHHFCILSDDSTVQVRDLNSELGTIVNEIPLGRDFAQDRIPLHHGENAVIAGGAARRMPSRSPCFEPCLDRPAARTNARRGKPRRSPEV